MSSAKDAAESLEAEAVRILLLVEGMSENYRKRLVECIVSAAVLRVAEIQSQAMRSINAED